MQHKQRCCYVRVSRMLQVFNERVSQKNTEKAFIVYAKPSLQKACRVTVPQCEGCTSGLALSMPRAKRKRARPCNHTLPAHLWHKAKQEQECSVWPHGAIADGDLLPLPVTQQAQGRVSQQAQ